MRCLACILVLGGCCCKAAAAHSSQVDAEVFAGHASNPDRAQNGKGVAAEDVRGANLSAYTTTLIDPNSGIEFQGAASLLTHSAYSGLNEVGLKARVKYRVQPTVGYTQPWYELSLGLERYQHASSAIRDATDATLGLTLGKRYTDRIAGTGGVAIRRELPDHGSVFDRTEGQLWAAVDYRYGIDNSLYARLSRSWGDQVFGGQEYTTYYRNVKASADDPAFGESRYAYRIHACTTLAEVGTSLPFPGYGTWDLRATRSRSLAYAGMNYSTTLLVLAWRGRFF